MLEVKPFSHRDSRFREFMRRGLRLDAEHDGKAADAVIQVKEQGDDGLLAGIREAGWRAADPSAIRVGEDELSESRRLVSEQFLTSLTLARVNARKFHEYQRRRGYVCDNSDGVLLSRQVRPLRRVGICCGESFSTLLMHAVPAQVAGVGEIAVAARPNPDGSIDPHILATAKILDIDEVYRMSGAHSVAAFAFGAGPVEKVDKIVGPGDSQTAAAMRLLAGYVGVDTRNCMTELAVIADCHANARFIAGDFLALAEQESAGMLALFTPDRLLAEAVRIEVNRLVDLRPNPERLRETLRRCGAIFICRDIRKAVEAVNALAPARLALHTSGNDECLGDIETAGVVFVGPWSSETAGGFFSGVNPFFPGGGQSRFASGLGVEDFVREMTVVEYGPDRLWLTGRHQEILAAEENLPCQAEAVRERLGIIKLTVE